MSGGSARGRVSVLAAAALWGTTGTAAALAPGVGPLAVGAAAMGLGGLLQAAAAHRALRASRRALAAQWPTLALAAAAVAGYPLAFYTSMRLAGVAVGTVVSIGCAPMAAAVVERVVDRSPLSRRWALGAGVGVLGVLVLALARTGQEPAAAGGSGTRPLLGIALGVLAGLTYAVYSWGAARMMRRGLPARPVMGAVFGAGGVLLLPVLLLTGAPIVAAWSHVAAVGYLAVVPMFLGYVLFGRGLAAVPASTATSLSLLEPAVAAVVAVLVLHEQLPAAGWAGMAVLLAGLVLLTAPGATGDAGGGRAPEQTRNGGHGREPDGGRRSGGRADAADHPGTPVLRRSRRPGTSVPVVIRGAGAPAPPEPEEIGHGPARRRSTP